MLSEPRRTDDKECGPPPGTTTPAARIARQADYAQLASSHGQQGVWAAAGYYCPSLRAIARHAYHAQRAAPHGQQ